MRQTDITHGPTQLPDPDHRASIRTLLAARLLRTGHQPHVIAELTGVPLALLELIRDEHHEPCTAATAEPSEPGSSNGGPATSRTGRIPERPARLQSEDRKPPKKRRNTPPSTGSGGSGGGAVSTSRTSGRE